MQTGGTLGGLSTLRIYYGSTSPHGLKLQQIIGKNGSTELVDAHYSYGIDGRLSQVRDNNATS